MNKRVTFGKEEISRLQNVVEKQKRIILNLQTECEILKQKLGEMNHFEDYIDLILARPQEYLSISEIANAYEGVDKFKLCEILKEEKLVEMQAGFFVPTSTMVNFGYVANFNHGLWTQKGRLRIHELLTKRNIKANMDKETANG